MFVDCGGNQPHRCDYVPGRGAEHGAFGFPGGADALHQHVHPVAAINHHTACAVIAFVQPVHQPGQAAAGGLLFDQRDAGRAIFRDHRAAQADSGTIRGKLDAVSGLALRLFRLAGAGRPGPGIQRLVALLRQNGAPPAQAFSGKAVGAHAPALLRRKLLAEPNAHGRVSLIPDRVIFEIDLVNLLSLH